MDCYFLKVKIIDFFFISKQENKDNNIELNNEDDINTSNNNYEIDFELTKSNEKYTLKIINDNNDKKIPFTNYFTIPTSINIDNNDDIFGIENNYIEKDLLEVSLYINNNEKKLIDIDNDILIDENCKKQPKISELNLGNFHIKFLLKLSCFEDLCLRENDINLMLSKINNENININKEEINGVNINDENINKGNDKENEVEIEEEDLVTKYHNILSNKPIDDEDEIIYDESLFQEIEPIDFQDISEINISKKEDINNENIHCGIYRDINTNDFFDINVDIFEEEEIEDEEDILDENTNNQKEETSNLNTNYKIYKNTHLVLYENISLGKPKLKEIIKNNLIDCFLVSGLSKTKRELPNSESYISQCKHKNCQYNKSYASDILFRLQKPNLLNFSEIDSLSISNLIFPYGIKICFGDNYLNHLFKKRSSSQFQEAEFSFNILTDIKGKRYYIYSLIFFIQFEFKEFIEYFKEYKKININIRTSSRTSKQINNYTIFIPFSFSLISKIFDLENFYKILNDIYTTFFTSQMEIEKFDNELIHLIFEIPSPPLNSKIKIFLPNLYTEIKSNIYENKIYNCINYFKILFQKNCYSIGFIIKIFILLILEKKVLIHSSKENKIYETIEVILNFIYPFKWVNTYIPLIPDENINLVLQSFLPFIIGMTHQSFFNFTNKIEKLNHENNQNGKYDNIFVINLDTENILPTKKINELVDICPIYETIEEKYHKLKNKGELDSDKIRNMFLEGVIDIIGDYQRYTSKLGENNLFNQKIFLRNKNKKYLFFYEEVTSTQQFYQFINEVNNDDDLYFNEFRDKIKLIKKKIDINNEDIYLDEYNLYPYFLKQQDNKEEIDLFTFEDEIDLYYNCLNKEHKVNYLLETEAYIRIQLILKNYIPNELKKYPIKKEFQKTNNNNENKKNKLYNIYSSNYDSNISTTDLENEYNFNNIKNVLGNIYGNLKKSIINNLFTDENKENKSNNIQNITSNKNDEIKKENKIPYRRRDSLIKMIKNNCDKNELLKYKEQIIDLLKDYMGYIFSNEKEDIPFTLNELSKLLSYRRIRREFSKILYQNKFDNDVEHELSEETFDLLYQTVFFCLVNLSDNKNEYKILRRVIKSMFYYFYKDLQEQKIYLYQKILEKNEKFYFIRSSNFWKYFYKIEKLEFPDNDNLTKIKNIMSMINVDSSIQNYLE